MKNILCFLKQAACHFPTYTKLYRLMTISIFTLLFGSFSYAEELHVKAANIDCYKANAEEHGTTAICLLCNVINADNAVDGDPATYSRFSTTVSATGTVWQELIFQENGKANDSIKVKIGTGGTLIDVGLLAGLSIETYNNNTSNNDGGILNGSLIDLEVLTGGNQAFVSFAAGGGFDRVRITYSPTLSLLSNGWRVYDAEIVFAPPSLVTQNLRVCYGTSAQLEVSPQANDSVRWYTSSSATTPVGTQNTFTTPALTNPGITTYYVTVVRNACENQASKVPIQIEVKPPYSSPDLSINVVTD